MPPRVRTRATTHVRVFKTTLEVVGGLERLTVAGVDAALRTQLPLLNMTGPLEGGGVRVIVKASSMPATTVVSDCRFTRVLSTL